jgi:hypothetical protein
MQPDEQFETLLRAYPAGRRQRGYLVTSLFVAALRKVPFDVLLAAVEQHKRSEQWKNPAMIPLMKTWFEEERWVQVLPEDVKAAEDARRQLLIQPTKPTIECEHCRDTGWADMEQDGKHWVAACSCRRTNSTYQRMTMSSRKTQNEEVKR